ncbi:MAG TPA: hypothetical protein ENK55_04950 [Actinobacteria bacterium]|nr:hypothetical protein [Actinomycetota bacterium]
MTRPSKDWGGFEIPEDVAAAAGLPEDLDSRNVGPYAVPDTARRRTVGLVYLAAAGAAAVAVVGSGLPTSMWWTTVGLLAAIGIFHLVTGRDLEVRERRALEIANRAVDFPVGHASAQLGFRGPLARPTWYVVVYSAETPPARRGLVRIDGITGDRLDVYVEDVPEA